MGPINSKITLTRKRKKEKETERRKKGGVEKKAMVALLVFMMASFGDNFWPEKKLFDTKDLFYSNVFKNPARHTR